MLLNLPHDVSKYVCDEFLDVKGKINLLISDTKNIDFCYIYKLEINYLNLLKKSAQYSVYGDGDEYIFYDVNQRSFYENIKTNIYKEKFLPKNFKMITQYLNNEDKLMITKYLLIKQYIKYKKRKITLNILKEPLKIGILISTIFVIMLLVYLRNQSNFKIIYEIIISQLFIDRLSRIYNSYNIIIHDFFEKYEKFSILLYIILIIVTRYVLFFSPFVIL